MHIFWIMFYSSQEALKNQVNEVDLWRTEMFSILVYHSLRLIIC